DRTDNRDRRMAGQRLFDHRRVDIMAAANDQILGAAGDEEIAVLVDAPQVAGAQEPAFGEKIPVLVILGIGRPLKDPGRADTDLANLIYAGLDEATIAVAVQDPHMAIGEDQPDRAGLFDP